MSSIDGLSCKALDIQGKGNTRCNWIKKEKLGEGAEGAVFNVCCDGNCDYVVKMYSDMSRYNFEDKFNKEVNIHSKFANMGVGVPIVEAFFCPDHGAYIIMEKRDMTIPQYYIYLKERGFNNEDLDIIMGGIIDDLVNMLDFAEEQNLIHNDTHLNNFMLNVNSNNSYDDLVAIDFGKSYEGVSNDDQPIRQRLEQSYDLMKRNPLEYMRVREKPVTRYRRLDRDLVESRRRMIFDEEDEEPKGLFNMSSNNRVETSRRLMDEFGEL